MSFPANLVSCREHDGGMALNLSATGDFFSATKTCSDFKVPVLPAFTSTGTTLSSCAIWTKEKVVLCKIELKRISAVTRPGLLPGEDPFGRRTQSGKKVSSEKQTPVLT